MSKGPHIVAGDPAAIANALIDGKPASPELSDLYTETLKAHVAALVKEHGIEIDADPNDIQADQAPDNVVPFERR